MTRAVTLAEIAAEEVLTVDGTNSRIGIGTTQPTTKLDVDGTISASDGMVVTGITTYQGDISIADKIIHTGDTNTSIRFPADDTVTIETAGSERVRVSSAGSFGIGTNNPASLLHVGSTSGGRIVFDPSAVSSGYECKIHPTDTGFEFSAGSNSRGFVFNTGVTPTPKLTISSTGLVGIGTDSPTEELHIAANVPGIRLEDIDNGYDSRILQSGASLYLDSDYNNVGSGAIRFRVGGTSEKMRIDSAGNVGIGTASPTGVLEIAGNSGVQTINYGDGTTTGYFLSKTNVDRPNADQAIHVNQFRWNGTQVAAIKALTGDDTVNKDNGYLTFETNDGSVIDERMRIASSGNVGIGTTNPTTLLEIESSGGGNAAGPVYSLMRNSASPANNDRLGTIHFDGKDSLDGRVIYKSVYARIYSTTSGSATGSLIVGSDETNGNEQVVIDGSGNVGIGTDNLGSRLQVEGSVGSNSRIHIKSTDIGQTTFDGSGSGLLLTAAGMNATSKFTPAIQFGTTDSNFTTTNPKIGAAINAIANEGYFADTDGGMDLAFYTTPENPGTGQTTIERMRITNLGQIFIHTTDNLPGTGNTSTGAMFERAGDGSGTTLFVSRDNNIVGRFNRNSDGNLLEFNRSGTAVGSVSVNTTNTAFNTSSDYRLKENVVDLDGAIDRVKQLAPKRFNFIVNADTTVDGFLAHEAQAVVPEAVTGTKDAVDEEGNPDYQGIDQSKLVPLLTAALKEAIAKIETLETQNADLVTRIEALEQA